MQEWFLPNAHILGEVCKGHGLPIEIKSFVILDFDMRATANASAGDDLVFSIREVIANCDKNRLSLLVRL